jgi:hypothetical protein
MDESVFWFQAMGYGGGLGIYGDFLYQAHARGGPFTAGTTAAGPAIGGGVQFTNMLYAELLALRTGEHRDFGRRLADFVRRNAPGSNLWYTRLATDRLIFDQVQALVDDQYWRSFQRQEDYYRRQGTNFWFPPGELKPKRAPALGNVVP